MQSQINTLKQQLIDIAQATDGNFKQAKQINIMFDDSLRMIEDRLSSLESRIKLLEDNAFYPEKRK